MMLVIPAIDLKGGKCVRLLQGRAEDETVYSDDPVSMARQWAGQGAEYLHVVDLDGAFEGRPVHTETIRRIVGAIDIPVEVGGGLRADAHVRELVGAGVDRAIIGTRAFADPDALASLVAEFGERLAVGIDARGGLVQVKGWVETTTTTAVALAARADGLGVRTIIYTDTATDGMLRGPNVEAMAELAGAVACNVVASGGVSTPDDVRALGALGLPNLRSCIVGKALYEGTSSLAELAAAGHDPAS